MDFTSICRTCLRSDNLKPIFNNTANENFHSTVVFLVTGLKVKLNDGLPQNMCRQCIIQMNNSLEFRKNSTESEKKLLALELNLDAAVKLERINKNQDIQDDIYNEIHIKTEMAEDMTDEELLKDNNYCDNEFDQNNDYHNAMRNEKQYEVLVSKGKGNRIKCNLCQLELSIRSVSGHMVRKHPGADVRKVKCELCEEYVVNNRLKRHIMVMHGNTGYKCGYCKIDFENKLVLIEHVSMCTAKKKKRKANQSGRELSECDVCHKSMQKASLRLHKAVKHAGLRPVCEHCGDRFGNKYRLSEHYRAKHGYDKFKCSYCDFESASVMAMRNHERRHRGEKPFACECCEAKFHAAYLLAQHVQSHRTEKLIKCEICPARFKANNSLNMHKMTCHSTFLYKCTMCSKAYRHYVVKHLRQVHQFSGAVPQLHRIPVKPEETGS